MNDAFCFLANVPESKKLFAFKSIEGKNYYLSYEANDCSKISLNVEWRTRKQSAINVKVYALDFSSIDSQFIIGKETAHFKFSVKCDKENFKLIFVITVMQYIELMDCPISPETKYTSNTSSDTIKDLTGDLLIGLAMDMRDLYKRGDMSDAIITNGSQVLKVHSAILLARSPVFRGMLKETSHNRTIIIPDACAETLEDMVMFIYSGYIKIKDIDRAEELYILSHKYDIQDLREICSLYMSNLTIDRALDTLVLADRYKDCPLRKVSMDFITRNLLEIEAGDKWTTFAEENADLALEAKSSVDDLLDEKALYQFMSKLSAKMSKNAK